jgi:tripartite-type tricarboxylate transporter receptor subunit TctC
MTRGGPAIAVVLLVVLFAGPTLAQGGDYPNRMVTIVAPSPPGGLYS